MKELAQLPDDVLKNRAGITVHILGKEIPKYKACPLCKRKLVCPFQGFCYYEPCDDCRKSPEWQGKQQLLESDRKGIQVIERAIKSRESAAVYTHYDKQGNPTHNLYINKNGDVTKDEPYKPLATGRQK